MVGGLPFMNVLIIYAHHEPTSFTASMKNLAVQTLTAQGHNVVVSDLYGQGFSAVAQKWDFVTTTGNHFNYVFEQKHAAQLGMSFAPDISGEIDKLLTAELVIFCCPVWWFSVPALMKGWFDRVLAMGVAWDSGKIYEKGLLRGKQAILTVSGGHPQDYYQAEGIHKAPINQILHPINHGTLAFCGFDVHQPFIAYHVLGADIDARTALLKEFETRMQHIVDSPVWLTKYQ